MTTVLWHGVATLVPLQCRWSIFMSTICMSAANRFLLDVLLCSFDLDGLDFDLDGLDLPHALFERRDTGSDSAPNCC